MADDQGARLAALEERIKFAELAREEMKQELHMMRKEAKAANEKVAEAMEQLSAKLDVLTELRNRAAGAVWLGLILVGAGVVGWIANAWHWWNQQGT